MPPSPAAGLDDDAPAIDVAHLAAQTMGDAGLAAELLDLFAQQAARIMHELAGVLGAAASARRRRADLLHTLCGSARAVGAWDVAAGAAQFETAERDATLTDMAPAAACDRLAALGRSVTQATAAIAAMREGAPSEASGCRG